MGIGLVPPRGVDDPTWHTLLIAIGRWMGSGGRLVVAGRTVWSLELAADERRMTLDPEPLPPAVEDVGQRLAGGL